MKQVIVITGASSGFGAAAARALAHAGHTVYASMRETRAAMRRRSPKWRSTPPSMVSICAPSNWTSRRGIGRGWHPEDPRRCNGRLDVIIHNAGHMSFGPAEAFTPEQFAQLYDINVLSTQRVNRAALPHCANRGAAWWSGCSSAAARAAARRLTSRPISRRRRRWIRWRSVLCQRACALGHRDLDHRARAPSPRAPITSHIRVRRPTRRAPPNMTTAPMPVIRTRR
jgi:NAD(P)-dependent dehydrogenase (short-subunit alcohol dehydrogenase family)